MRASDAKILMGEVYLKHHSRKQIQFCCLALKKGKTPMFDLKTQLLVELLELLYVAC
jgi:hypothetical protein